MRSRSRSHDVNHAFEKGEKKRELFPTANESNPVVLRCNFVVVLIVDLLRTLDDGKCFFL